MSNLMHYLISNNNKMLSILNCFNQEEFDFMVVMMWLVQNDCEQFLKEIITKSQLEPDPKPNFSSNCKKRKVEKYFSNFCNFYILD